MKIAFIAQSTRNLVTARIELIKKIREKGHEVLAIIPEEKYTDELKKNNIKYRITPIDRVSIGVISNIKYFNSLRKVLKEEKVDSIFAYTIKPIIFGTIAGKLEKVKDIYLLIPGMGYIYSLNSLKIKLIRAICNVGYKYAFKNSTKVIFQNKEDRQEFIDKEYVTKEKSYVIDGSGVDLNRFKKTPLPDNETFIMVSRRLKIKGVIEFCKAAEIVKARYTNARFIHVGEEEKTFRGVKQEEIQKYIDNGIVEFMGRKEDIPSYIENSLVIVLPSLLREGIPRFLLEALACGRPIIATDINGSRETVVNGKNGFLVAKNDVQALAEKMIFMLENKDKLQEMGEYSYKLAKERFDVNIINQKMIDILEL